MTEFRIASFHHEVLAFWAAWKREHGDTELNVLCLDHHTDVVRAFRDDSVPVGEGAWRNPEAVRDAISRLRHDEHFDWAVRSGLVEEVFISSHTRATVPACDALHVLCDPRWPDENEFLRNQERYRALADSVLESDYLVRQFGGIDRYGPFILDIDCDYFLTRRALFPRDSACLDALLRRAELVTVSLESDWVRLLRFRNEDISGPVVAAALAERVKSLCRAETSA
ncbi:MAG: UPF0489 family protein [Lentisphaeria bacterium]|nr:UPF0489 family protein [Lentisphaeria bacterium]